MLDHIKGTDGGLMFTEKSIELLYWWECWKR